MSSFLTNRGDSKSFSRDGFARIPGETDHNMANHDATIDIPLEQVPSYSGGGYRNMATTSALNTSDADAAQAQKRVWFSGRRQKPEAYQNHKKKKKGKVGYDGEEETVNTMGHIYRRVMAFSTLTRYFVYVSPLALLFAAPIIITAVTGSDAKIGGVLVMWFFTWVEIVWLSLWGAKTFAHYLPHLFQVLAGVVSSGVRKYSAVIRTLEVPISLVGWAVTALATFKPIMSLNESFQTRCVRDRRESTNPEQFNCDSTWTAIVQKILAATVFAAVIYLVEKLIIQLISINYHRKQFNARIKESKRNIWILGLLYDASRALFPMYCNEFAEEDYVIADQLDLHSRSHSRKASKRKSMSHTPIRIMQDIGHGVDKITSAFGHVAQEVTGKQVFNPNSAHSIVIEALEKTRTSEALARRIWMSFVMEGKDALYEEDIVEVLGANHREQAEEAFYTFDKDMNGDVSLDEFILTVTQFGRDRKSITSSIHDVDQAINVLDKLLIFVAFIIIVLTYVAWLNASFVSTLATAGTALISLSFVFSVTAQEVLGSCIFLFVKHPFDIGDRVEIGTTGCINQEHFVVEHISLLFCVFRHVQGPNVGRNCQIPNILLNSLWISNVSRSKAMTEQLTISIAFETSFDDLQILKNELVSFVTDKDNSRDYQPTVDLDVMGTTDQSNMTLLVEIKHKGNWANETVRRARRSKFMCALVSALKAVPIYPPGGAVDAVGSAALPTYTVTIPHNEVKEHAEEAAEAREKARLVPIKKPSETGLRLSPSATREKDSSAGTTLFGVISQEVKAGESLTNTNPASDPARDETWSRDDSGSSTVGGRPSIDRQDINQQDLAEVRDVLRRESTRGKRKPSMDEYRPSIPAIDEQNYGGEGYYPSAGQLQQSSSTGYENVRPGGYSTMPAPYRLPTIPQGAMYQSEQVSSPVLGQAVEMGQFPPARSLSNPFRSTSRSRTDSSRADDIDDEWGNDRPYSGV